MDQRTSKSSPVILILWLALTLSIVLYAILAGVVAVPTEPAVEGAAQASETLKTPLTAFAVLDGLLALFVFFGIRKKAKSASEAMRFSIIAYALSESVALFGFVLAILLKQPDLVYPFCGGAILLNIAMFPGLPKNQMPSGPRV